MHSATLPRPAVEQPKAAHRPVHPAIQATEALIEALVAIEDDAEALDHSAQASATVARALHERAKRLREKIAPEVRRGYEAAEALTAAGARG